MSYSLQSGPSETSSGGTSSNYSGAITFGNYGGSQGFDWKMAAALAGVAVLYFLITKKRKA
jgi:hypothetical protein